MTDGESTIVQHQSLNTHNPRHKYHLLVLLSLCAQSPVRCLDFFLTAKCMQMCVCPSLPWFIKLQLKESLVRSGFQPVGHMGHIKPPQKTEPSLADTVTTAVHCSALVSDWKQGILPWAVN